MKKIILGLCSFFSFSCTVPDPFEQDASQPFVQHLQRQFPEIVTELNKQKEPTKQGILDSFKMLEGAVLCLEQDNKVPNAREIIYDIAANMIMDYSIQYKCLVIHDNHDIASKNSFSKLTPAYNQRMKMDDKALNNHFDELIANFKRSHGPQYELSDKDYAYDGYELIMEKFDTLFMEIFQNNIALQNFNDFIDLYADDVYVRTAFDDDARTASGYYPDVCSFKQCMLIRCYQHLKDKNHLY